jgi:heavy metal translocating P-type ATPase
MNTATLALTGCRHCGTKVSAGEAFCCSGCEAVFSLLQERGLGHYYELRDRFSFRKPTPVKTVSEAAGFAEEIGARTRNRFYIEGIHCLGCLWILEKLPELEPRVVSSSLDIAHQILDVEVHGEKRDWQRVLQLLSRLGYSAKPLRDEDGGENERRRDQRRQVARLATAAFCAGNIMLLTVSLYAGADAFWVGKFQGLSLALAVPSLTYAAWPLYRSAFGPLRHGRLSVDFPIAIAVLAGIALSLGSLAFGNGSDTYFDSLSMLVFLLLASRYLLSRYRESMAKATPYLSFLSAERFLRGGSPVRAEALRAGDRLELRAGQRLPVDSVLVSATSYFSLALLTGESAPVKYQRGDRVEAGSELIGNPAELLVEREVGTSRLQRLLDQIQARQLRGSPSLDFADRMGRYFVWVVLTLATGTFAAFANDPAEGLRRALALVIVTCPCVLAFAVPLALTRALQRAASRGILVRGADKVEELAAARTIFLDKTGTLTSGNYSVLSWENLSGNHEDTVLAVHALESGSSHPVGKAISRYLQNAVKEPTAAAEYLREIPGQGVEGIVAGSRWSVLRANDGLVAGENHVIVHRNDVPVARIALGDSVRPEARFVVDSLKQLGLRPCLLSGDTSANVALVAERLGVEDWHAHLLPEQKAEIAEKVPHSIMVGDGANDAVAFRAASVGVATQGSVELSLQNADVVLTKPGLAGLIETILLARDTAKLVRINFAFTLTYNVIAGGLAIAGLMSPLLAAVLMPLSALTVFTYTQIRTRRDA